MPPAHDRCETLEDVRIVFRNFEGREGQYNRAGDRNFSILLDDPNKVRQLERDGWAVKYLKAKEEGEDDQPYLPVAVSYRNRPPRIVLITHRGRNPLSEAEVEMLDWVDIETVDVTLSPYEWAVRGETGIKAYLRTMYVKIHEDPLDLKWSDMQASGGRSDG